jgi:YegS/Rv2252/BmrU family lipid kinase
VSNAVRARFLVNPFSGLPLTQPRPYGLIEKAFLGSDWDVDIRILKGKGDGEAQARRAVKEGVELVVGIGGDGTLHEIGNGLVGTETSLGIVPLGSGNAFARALGVPMVPHRAIRALLSGRPIALDVGEVEGRVFLSTAGIGLDAAVGQEFDKSPIRGGIPYFGIAAMEFLQYQPVEVRVETDGQSRSLRPLLVTVANTNQFGMGAVIAPKARPDDGLLDVCLISEVSVLEALIHSPKLFLGAIDQVPHVEIFQTKEVRVSLEREVPAHLDGEPTALSKEIVFRVRPRALRVWLPAASD